MRQWTLGLIVMASTTSGIGCVGSMGGNEEVSEEVEGYSYDQLKRTVSTGGGEQSLGEESGWVPGSGTDVQTSQVASIIRVRVCHYGELDYVKLRAVQENEGQVPLILTLETDAGTVLASQTLDRLALISGPTEKVGTTKEFQQTLSITVPGALADGKTFRLNEYICLDTNRNGSCHEELVGDLRAINSLIDAIASKARIIAFKPLRAHVDGTVLAIEPEDPDAADDATQKVLDTVKLLDPAEYKSSPPGPLDLALALHTPYGECKKARLRSNGCFVAGTRIELGDGRVLPVEYSFEGMEIVGLDGQRRRAILVEGGPEREPVVVIRTAAGHELTVTQGHPMFTARGLKRAGQLTRKDSLLMASGDYSAIALLSRESYTGLVYNFALDDGPDPDASSRNKPHQVVSNGIVVGDLVLQHRLMDRALPR